VFFFAFESRQSCTPRPLVNPVAARGETPRMQIARASVVIHKFRAAGGRIGENACEHRDSALYHHCWQCRLTRRER
jgi:hypothetical protein